MEPRTDIQARNLDTIRSWVRSMSDTITCDLDMVAGSQALRFHRIDGLPLSVAEDGTPLTGTLSRIFVPAAARLDRRNTRTMAEVIEAVAFADSIDTTGK